MKIIFYFIPLLLGLLFSPVYSELKYSAGIVFKNSVVGIHLDKYYVRGEKVNNNVESFSIGVDGKIQDAVTIKDGDKYLNGEYIGKADIHYLDNGSILITYNYPEEGEDYYVTLDNKTLFQGSEFQYKKYMLEHTFSSSSISKYFIDNEGKVYRLAGEYEEIRFLDIDNVLVYDFFCENDFLKYSYNGENLTELIGSASVITFFKNISHHSVNPTVLLNIDGTLHDIKDEDYIHIDGCRVQYYNNGDYFSLKVDNNEIIPYDQEDLEKYKIKERVLNKYKTELDGKIIFISKLENTYVTDDKKFFLEIREDNYGLVYYLNGERVFDDNKYIFQGSDVLDNSRFVYNSSENLLYHNGEIITFVSKLSEIEDAKYEYSISVSEYEKILMEAYKNNPPKVYASKVKSERELNKQLAVSRERLINIRNGEKYVGLVDKLINKYRSNTRILELLYKRVGEIKDKTKSNRKKAILYYIESKIAIILNNY